MGWRVSFDQTGDGEVTVGPLPAEHRVEFRVECELPELFRAAAGAAILAALQRFLAGGTSTTVTPPMACAYGPSVTVPSVPTISPSGFPVRRPRYRGVEGLLEDRVRGLGHGGHVLVGDVVHRVGTEQDQVPRHPMTPLSPACGRCGLSLVPQTSPPPGSHRCPVDLAPRRDSMRCGLWRQGVSAGQSYRTGQAGDGAADDHALDLGGPLEDGEDSGLASSFRRSAAARGPWYQHGISTGFSRVRRFPAALRMLPSMGGRGPRMRRRPWQPLSAEYCAEVHRRYIFALTCQYPDQDTRPCRNGARPGRTRAGHPGNAPRNPG